MSSTELKKNVNLYLNASNDVNGVKSQYFCPVCKKVFKDDVSLKVHGLLHVENCYCTICKRQYMPKNFRKHVEAKHLNIVCNICGKVYVKKKSLRLHMESHHTGVLFECEKCDKTFKQKGALKTHTHYAHEGIRLKCEKCNGNFTTKSSLTRHIKSLHSKNTLFRCRICLEEFKEKQSMLNHENSHNLSHKECHICSRKFKETRYLKNHLAMIHFKNEKCPYCHEKFHKSVLQTHVDKVHFKNEKCPYCHEKFHKSVLQRHIDKVHSTNACNECGKTFFNKKALFQHLKNHTVPPNDKIFYGTYCHTYHTMLKLIRHSKEQQKKLIKMFHCKVCSKKFTKANELNKHYIKHSIYRPFGCDLCLERFKHNLQLNRHMSRMHNEKKFKCEMCCVLFQTEKLFEHHKCLVENISCTICNEKCKTKLQMHEHLINIHSPTTGSSVTCNVYQLNRFKTVNVLREGKFRYQCTKCFKRYSILKHFKRHVCITVVKSKHSPPFCCTLCGLLCSRKKTMQRHLTIHVHKTKPTQDMKYEENHIVKIKSEENQSIESDLLEIKNEYIDVTSEGHQIFVNPLEVNGESYSGFSIKKEEDDSELVFDGKENNFLCKK